jgi:hypothetical protein
MLPTFNIGPCAICGGRLEHYASYHGKWNIGKCVECGFGQSNVTNEDIECFYESDYFAGKTGDFSQDHDAWIDEGRQWWIDTFVPGINISCLEVGPGTSATLGKYLMQSRPGIKYEAVEVSSFASERLKRAGLRFKPASRTTRPSAMQCGDNSILPSRQKSLNMISIRHGSPRVCSMR